MRRTFRVGSKLYKPDNRLGSAMVRAADIADRTLLGQIVVAADGLALLDVYSAGRTAVVVRNSATGREARLSGKAWLAIQEATRG